MRLAAALIPLALAGCGSAPSGPIEVAALLAQCDAYLGKPVQLVGYLGECSGYACHLFADEPAAKSAARGSAIGVASNGDFDAKAAPFQREDVVITGTMDKTSCTGEGGTDRSPGIIPTDIRAWTPDGAPGNSH